MSLSHVRVLSVLCFAWTLLLAKTKGQERPPGVPLTAKYFNGHWYEFIKSNDLDPPRRPTWDESYEIALKKGGHLACIETPDEWAFIIELMKTRPGGHIWTSGFYSETAGWRWINNTAVDESKLKNPSQTNSENRLFANNLAEGIILLQARRHTKEGGGLMVEYSPEEEVESHLPGGQQELVNYFRKKSGNQPSNTPTARPSGIPDSAIQFNGHWYDVKSKNDVVAHDERLYWDQAQEFAQNQGGYLACIETAEEHGFIKMLLTAAKPDFRYWLGGFFTGTEWKWINGSPFAKESPKSMDPGRRILIGHANRAREMIDVDSSVFGNGLIVEYTPGEDFSLTLPSKQNSKPTTTTTSSKNNSTPPDGPMKAIITGNAHAAPLEIKRNQSRVYSLLVIDLGGLNYAGSTSAMTLIALPIAPETPATLQFNQNVGATMQKALEEVVKFSQLRHNGWPRGHALEISFENKYNPKDGPSAAVACALLLESAITGDPLDAGFAVTGDMNADGSVQPIGGVEAKLRGATNQKCSTIAIPFDNVTSVYDSVVMDGIRSIIEIQVFSINSFDEAYSIARSTKSESVQSALNGFSEIQEIYRKNPTAFYNSIRHPKAIERLQEILKGMPNHLSASILLTFAQGRIPDSLSLPGSFTFIDQNAHQIVDVIQDGEVSELQDFDHDQVSDALSLLRRSKLKLDKRTWDWADDLSRWGELMREYQTNRPKSTNNVNKLIDDINAAGDAARAERSRLLENPEVMEELQE
ncbi:MAG: lectin-like protein [Verrucomicrobiales bacterium]|nr:lectin-like protein [Verrucomicrobiales bacterium]